MRRQIRNPPLSPAEIYSPTVPLHLSCGVLSFATLTSLSRHIIGLLNGTSCSLSCSHALYTYAITKIMVQGYNSLHSWHPLASYTRDTDTLCYIWIIFSMTSLYWCCPYGVVLLLLAMFTSLTLSQYFTFVVELSFLSWSHPISSHITLLTEWNSFLLFLSANDLNHIVYDVKCFLFGCM